MTLLLIQKIQCKKLPFARTSTEKKLMPVNYIKRNILSRKLSQWKRGEILTLHGTVTACLIFYKDYAVVLVH